MHGVKRSLVCFVAVASANPPFIQPSETSRETTESMNDRLIKLNLNACFLLNTPTTQQNHPSAPCHVSYARYNGSPSHADADAEHAARHPTHHGQQRRSSVHGHPETERSVFGAPPLEESRPKFCCCRAVSRWVVPCHKFFPGSAARHGAAAPVCRRLSFL